MNLVVELVASEEANNKRIESVFATDDKILNITNYGVVDGIYKIMFGYELSRLSPAVSFTQDMGSSSLSALTSMLTCQYLLKSADMSQQVLCNLAGNGVLQVLGQSECVEEATYSIEIPPDWDTDQHVGRLIIYKYISLAASLSSCVYTLC